MKNLQDVIESRLSEQLSVKIDPFERSICHTGLLLYYAYLKKHPENIGNGDASPEAVAKIADKIWGGGDFEKFAARYDKNIR